VEQSLPDFVGFLSCIEGRFHQGVPARPVQAAALEARLRLLDLYNGWVGVKLRLYCLQSGDRPSATLFSGSLGDWRRVCEIVVAGYAAARDRLDEILEGALPRPPSMTPKAVEEVRDALLEILKEIALYYTNPNAPNPNDKAERIYCTPPVSELEREPLFLHRALEAIYEWKTQLRAQVYMAVREDLMPLNTVASHQLEMRNRYIDPCREQHRIPDEFR
jgi:hypothetical protein